MSRKSKGTNAERELVHLFWAAGWAAIRIAGSGSSRYPSADVLASNTKRVLAIESKATKENAKYFDDEEIGQLLEFSGRFGAEPWIAIKFLRAPWFFLRICDLEQTKSTRCLSLELAMAKGLGFEKLIGIAEVPCSELPSSP